MAGFFMCNLYGIRTTELQHNEMGDCTTTEGKPSFTKSTVYESEFKFVSGKSVNFPFPHFQNEPFVFSLFPLPLRPENSGLKFQV